MHEKRRFSHLRVSPSLSDGRATVGVDVTNTGRRTGADVAQVYLADPAAAGEPPRQLKGFVKVTLRPGQRKHLTFTLDSRAFSIWNSASAQWTLTSGRYGALVGGSSRDLRLHGTVVIDSKRSGQTTEVAADTTSSQHYGTTVAPIRLRSARGHQ
jgi:beta-glucosidase